MTSYRRRRFHHPSRRGAAFVAAFEGFRSRPYRDAVGVWTIGYGHTAGVKPTTPPMSRRRALALLRTELDTYADAVRSLERERVRAGRRPFTQPQGDALTSFVYNLGPGAIGPDTTIGRLLRAGHDRQAADAMLAWDKAGGRVLLGLLRRRQAERRLYRHGIL